MTGNLDAETTEAYEKIGGTPFVVLATLVVLVTLSLIVYNLFPFLIVPLLVICAIIVGMLAAVRLARREPQQ